MTLRDLAQLTHTDFEPLIGEPFELHLEGTDMPALKLIEVTPRGAAPEAADGGQKTFSLLFEGPQAPILPQNIYRIGNTSFGEMELFLVPVGPATADPMTMTYDATFG